MELVVGKIVEGTVSGITNFGAFIDLGEGKTGLVHISEVSNSFVKQIADFLKQGDKVQVKVLKVSDDGKISLSIKQAQPVSESPRRPAPSRPPKNQYHDRPRQQEGPQSFEDMLSKFKQRSEEKMSDIKRNMDGKRGGSGFRRGSK